MKSILLTLFPIMFSVLLFSCSKDDDTEPKDENTENVDDNTDDEDDDEDDEVEITAEYYFSGFIGSNSVVYQHMVDGYYSNAGKHSSFHGWDGESIGCYGMIHKMEGSDVLYENTIRVTISKYFPEEATASGIDSMYHVGKYQYGVYDDLTVNQECVYVEYYDNDGEEWSTERGDQLNSSFQLIERSEFVSNYQTISIKAEFNCKLYNSNGDVLELKDANFSGLIGSYL